MISRMPSISNAPLSPVTLIAAAVATVENRDPEFETQAGALTDEAVLKRTATCPAPQGAVESKQRSRRAGAVSELLRDG